MSFVICPLKESRSAGSGVVGPEHEQVAPVGPNVSSHEEI